MYTSYTSYILFFPSNKEFYFMFRKQEQPLENYSVNQQLRLTLWLKNLELALKNPDHTMTLGLKQKR